MAKKLLLIEWKARDLKNKHAWIVDRHDLTESKLCEPMVSTGYIDPKRVGYRSLTMGKTCKICEALFVGVKAKFGDKIEEVKISGTEIQKSKSLEREIARKVRS